MDRIKMKWQIKKYKIKCDVVLPPADRKKLIYVDETGFPPGFLESYERDKKKGLLK